MLPDWGEVLGLPVPERMARLADPQTRAHLAERATSPDAGVFSRLTGWGGYRMGDTFSPDNHSLTGRTVAEIAVERGTEHFDTLVDVVLADELRTVLWPAPTDDDDESWQLRAEAWQSEHTLLGGSDARAPTRSHVRRPLHHRLSGRLPAGSATGLAGGGHRHADRRPGPGCSACGSGAASSRGWHADLVVFDPETVDSGTMRLVEDLPGGSARLFADAVGVDHVLVNGPAHRERRPAHRRPARHAAALRARHRDRAGRVVDIQQAKATLAQLRRRGGHLLAALAGRLDTRQFDQGVPWIIALLFGGALSGLSLARARSLDAVLICPPIFKDCG